MPLKKQINDLHKNHKKSVSENLLWYEETLKNKSSMGVYKLPASHYFKPGKIYRFRYHPNTKLNLPYYDSNPLVLSLGKKKFQTGNVDLCLNLNYFPYTVKVYIINTIYKAYKTILNNQIRQFPFDARRQNFYALDYETIISLLGIVNISFGIRNYLRANRTKASVISYDNFYRLPFVEEYKFVKKGIAQVHSIYYKTLKG